MCVSVSVCVYVSDLWPSAFHCGPKVSGLISPVASLEKCFLYPSFPLGDQPLAERTWR